jgi:hypothetical protein
MPTSSSIGRAILLADTAGRWEPRFGHALDLASVLEVVV